MPLPVVSPIQVAVRGRTHTFSCASGILGTLEAGAGRVARFTTPDGLPLSIRREPGITASHYQMWNDRGAQVGEFFASSYRWSLFMRRIRVHYGNNDYVLVPKAAFGFGFDLTDNKGKRILAIAPASLGGRKVTITLDKAETELACIVFAYFLARTTWLRSFWRAASVGGNAADAKPVVLDAATQNAHAKAAELARSMMPGPKAGGDAPTKETAGASVGSPSPKDASGR